MKTKTSQAQQAAAFVSRCSELGWRVTSITDTTITITKRFTPGCRDGLVECDMEYYDVLALCPFKGGSVWGTDCGGIGAMSALNTGVFRMSKSGSGGKRFVAEVQKLLK
jgi:hypothetical protein